MILNEVEIVFYSLYIPLCFYYIPSGILAAWALVTFTFHYASTISMEGDVTTCFIILYIPLCFYYIGFNRSSRIMDQLFTFHYASTISIISMQKTRISWTLHSTMLLLYHDYQSRLDYTVQLYIPLCFYYIISMCVSTVPCFIFTFHYASTISFFRLEWFTRLT